MPAAHAIVIARHTMADRDLVIINETPIARHANAESPMMPASSEIAAITPARGAASRARSKVP